jgi:hypothetical protein
MGDLEPAGASRHGELDDLVQPVDVLAVHGGVDGEGEADLGHPGGDLALLGMAAAVLGDAVGVGRLDILD